MTLFLHVSPGFLHVFPGFLHVFPGFLHVSAKVTTGQSLLSSRFTFHQTACRKRLQPWTEARGKRKNWDELGVVQNPGSPRSTSDVSL